MQKVLLVALGGALGSVLRYLGILLFPQGNFPWAVFAVNVLGCLIAGILVRLTESNSLSGTGSILLITGFLGGFTTYSAFSIDTLNLIRNKEFTLAFTYAAGTVIAAIASVAAGFWLCGIFLRYLR